MIIIEATADKLAFPRNIIATRISDVGRQQPGTCRATQRQDFTHPFMGGKVLCCLTVITGVLTEGGFSDGQNLLVMNLLTCHSLCHISLFNDPQ